METISKIVVASDSLHGMDTALEKAHVMEHYSGADVCVAEAVYDHVADEATETIDPEEKVQLVEALKARERKGLKDLAEPYRERIASLESRVLWDKNKVQAILALMDETGADLLIKPVSHHLLLTDYLHAPSDWSLMRHSDAPVLVSKKPWPVDRCVLACIDAGNQAHEHLNQRVLRTARLLSAVIGGQLHVVSVYSDLGQRVDGYQVAIDFEGLKAEMKERRENEIARWNAELELDATPHVLSGDPAKVIAALASDLDATVTVVGTAARGGLAKFFIGNTSEDLIRQLECDVLSVRDTD